MVLFKMFWFAFLQLPDFKPAGSNRGERLDSDSNRANFVPTDGNQNQVGMLYSV